MTADATLLPCYAARSATFSCRRTSARSYRFSRAGTRRVRGKSAIRIRIQRLSLARHVSLDWSDLSEVRKHPFMMRARSEAGMEGLRRKKGAYNRRQGGAGHLAARRNHVHA